MWIEYSPFFMLYMTGERRSGSFLNYAAKRQRLYRGAGPEKDKLERTNSTGRKDAEFSTRQYPGRIFTDRGIDRGRHETLHFT